MIWSARLRTALGHAHAERPRRLQVDDELCRRLLRRSASESGRLCHGDGGHEWGRPPPEGVHVAYPLYRRTKNLRAVQLLLGHTKLESTVRYLGIEVDDALEIAEQTEV